jgi:cell division protein FtsB
MAYTKREIYSTEIAYPDLRPVTERQLKRQPVRKSQYKKRTTRAEYLFYLAVNSALVFGLVQCTRALISEGFNLSRLATSQTAVQQFFNHTQHENRGLNDKIQLYSSTSGIEELARNYLNMVGENELPVRFQ